MSFLARFSLRPDAVRLWKAFLTRREAPASHVSSDMVLAPLLLKMRSYHVSICEPSPPLAIGKTGGSRFHRGLYSWRRVKFRSRPIIRVPDADNPTGLEHLNERFGDFKGFERDHESQLFMAHVDAFDKGALRDRNVLFQQNRDCVATGRMAFECVKPVRCAGIKPGAADDVGAGPPRGNLGDRIGIFRCAVQRHRRDEINAFRRGAGIAQRDRRLVKPGALDLCPCLTGLVVRRIPGG
jgi:hypothetical protein